LPTAEEQRYAELVALRDAEALSPAEHADLLRLNDARADLLHNFGAAAATDAG
jgi:hypothetical protein